MMTAVRHKGSTGTHPNKFGLYIGLAAIVMLFAGLTSAYIVQQADRQNWFTIKLPSIFILSTILIMLSSATMYYAGRMFKRNNLLAFRVWITATLVLGLGFCLTQFLGWQDLQFRQIFLSGHPSGSFIYVLTGLHIAHVIGGIVALIIVLVMAYRRFKSNSDMVLDRAATERHIIVENVAVYWHFVDVLWVYLFVFFTYFNS